MCVCVNVIDLSLYVYSLTPFPSPHPPTINQTDLPSASAGASLLDDLLHAYSDAGNATLYRPLLKAYFAQVFFNFFWG